jgi:hypothetical protein
MTPQKRNPHVLGAGLRKLLGWAQANANTVANAIMVLLLATMLVWRAAA